MTPLEIFAPPPDFFSNLSIFVFSSTSFFAKKAAKNIDVDIMIWQFSDKIFTFRIMTPHTFLHPL